MLITGAAGFIGHHLALSLAEGRKVGSVVGLDNYSPYYSVALKQARAQRLSRAGGVRVVEGDVCNRSLVGYLNLSTVNWGQHPHPGQRLSTVDYWHGNTLTKTYGSWYSSWREGQCREDDPRQAFCSWRLAEPTTKIAKECSDR